MNSSLVIQLCSLLYISFLIIIYFSKERLRNVENKIFMSLMISNLVGLLLDILCIFTVNNIDSYPILNNIANRLYLLYYHTWVFIFLLYIFAISINKDKFKSIDCYERFVNEKIKMFFIPFMLFNFLIIFLPLNYYKGIDGMHSYGLSVNLLYGIVGIDMFICILLMIFNYQNLKKQKYVPLFAFMILGAVAMVIQKQHPNLILIPAVETFITFLMYFTIENPDLKMMNELELAKKNAERANNAKTEFLSSMSHEIRTPLNAIVGFSNSILEDDNIDEIKEEAKDIIMASNNLLEIVNGILDISKIEAGKMEIVNVNYKPRVIFNDLVKLIKPRIGEKPIELKTSFSDDIPYELYGDMGKVKEIIKNLLTNAAKYTDKGIIDFSVSCINEKNYSKLVISVEDTGRGIKPEKIDKLFTKFNRLEEDRNTTLEGTGLGLAITKSLVEMMGGKIIVQSKYGSGSKFTVYLKQGIVSMNNNGKEKEEVIVEDKELDYSNKKVLIVDDNNLNIKVASRMLKNYNITPDCVSSGMECLEKVGANKYDLILLDDMMPKMSGVETLAKLKNDDSFDTPVVVLTANAISGMREKYIKDGFCDYLAKPIDKLELRRVLNEYLDKK